MLWLPQQTPGILPYYYSPLFFYLTYLAASVAFGCQVIASCYSMRRVNANLKIRYRANDPIRGDESVNDTNQPWYSREALTCTPSRDIKRLYATRRRLRRGRNGSPNNVSILLQDRSRLSRQESAPMCGAQDRIATPSSSFDERVRLVRAWKATEGRCKAILRPILQREKTFYFG